MDEVKIKELTQLHSRIEELANSERFGANHYDYPTNINLFEILVGQFYEIASNMEWEINLMNDILDGQHSLNRQFMYLRSELCVNKFGRIGQKKIHFFYAIKKKCIFANRNK